MGAWVLLIFIDPFPPRDSHCFPLSLLCCHKKEDHRVENTGSGPISLLFKPASLIGELMVLTRPVSVYTNSAMG